MAGLGFNPDRLLLVDVKVPEAFRKDRIGADEWAKSVLSKLRAIEGIQRVSRSDSVPIRWGAWKPTTLAVDGTMKKGLTGGAWVVGDGYFATAGIPVLEGREFNTTDTAISAPRVVISQTLAQRLWPNERVMGKQLQILVWKSDASGKPSPAILERLRKHDPTLENDPTVLEPVEGKSWEVIGVVQDVRMFSLDVAGNPALYVNYEQKMRGMDLAQFSVKFLIRTSEDPTGITARAKTAVMSVNNHAVVTEIARMQDIVSAKVGGRGTSKLMVVVSTVFGSLALTFAVIGIYGVVSHTVSQRMREVGIRVALGADRRDVARLVIGYSVRLLFSGLALGLTAAWATTRVLQSQLAGVKVTDAVTYALAIALLAGAVMVASIVPLRRALRADPMALMRTT
jgi:putative ABC transport system permease protein